MKRSHSFFTTAQHSQDFLYLETSLTGRTTFENAVLSASRGLGKFPPEQVIRIAISQARAQGIFPMPEPGKATAMQNEAGR